MMVTPEMLLWLAGKMGLPVARIKIANDTARGWYERIGFIDSGERFDPHTDDAQFGRLVVLAAWEGVTLLVTGTYVSAASEHRYSPGIEHDSTPDSIRAAAVVAICRAMGWEGEME